jgi:hypothetical protein
MLNETPKLTPFKLFTLWRTITYIQKLCIYRQNHINLRFGVVQLQKNIKISLNFDHNKLNRKMCCIYNIKNNDGEITYFREHYTPLLIFGKKHYYGNKLIYKKMLLSSSSLNKVLESLIRINRNKQNKFYKRSDI